jgi:hypothetical protein
VSPTLATARHPWILAAALAALLGAGAACTSHSSRGPEGPTAQPSAEPPQVSAPRESPTAPATDGVTLTDPPPTAPTAGAPVASAPGTSGPGAPLGRVPPGGGRPRCQLPAPKLSDDACQTDAECAPSVPCHAPACVAKSKVPPPAPNVMCTREMRCDSADANRCGCIQGRCALIPPN